MRIHHHVIVVLASMVSLTGPGARAQSWVAAPAFPGTEPRLDAAGLRVGGVIMAIGGSPLVDGADRDAPVHSLSPGDSAWITLTPLHGAAIHRGVGVDTLGRVVVFGGLDPESGDLGDNCAYDPAAGLMTVIAPRADGVPADWFAYCTDAQHRVYSLGGGPGPLATVDNPNTGVAARYDAMGDAWESLPDMPTPVGAAAAVYDGRGHVLVLGGVIADGSARTANVAQFDVASGAWSDSAIPGMPVAISRHCAVLGADGRVYVLGGEAGQDPVGSVVGAVFRLDLDALVWTELPPMTVPRADFGAARGADDFIYAMGGRNGDGGTNTVEKLYTTPCPEFTRQPAPAAVWRGTPAVFSADVTGGMGTVFRWRRDGQGLSDGPGPGGGTISGAGTICLVVSAAADGDAGWYDLMASNDCGAVASNRVSLSIRTPPAIPDRWSATSLHPAWALWSRAMGVIGGRQVGGAGMAVPPYSNIERPVVWAGDAESGVDLTPLGSVGGGALGAAADDLVGWWWSPYTCDGGGEPQTCYARQACLWSGGESVNLQVPGWDFSTAIDTDGTMHVGTIWRTDAVGNHVYQAGYWSGPEMGFRSLHPEVAVNSGANAVSDGHVFGWVHVQPGLVSHATMWGASSDTFVDLHPAGAARSSVYGARDGQQVGMADLGGIHAGLWSLSTWSFVDLNPPGATASEAFACKMGLQAGSATVAGQTRAVIWAGSGDVCVDLHSWLPSEFISSVARAMEILPDGSVTVVGYGSRVNPARTEALMWRSLRCAADFNGDGAANSQDFFDYLNAFFAGDPAADFNADGTLNSQDFFEFVNAFFVGCG